MNLLDARKELIEDGWELTSNSKTILGLPCEIEIWQNNVRMILIQSFDNDPSVIGASKSFHVFRIQFTSLGHSDSPFKLDTMRMLKEAMK